MTRENNSQIGKTYKWYYDNAGNILKREEYAYTTGTLGAVVDTVNYTYGDSAWGDLLTAYDGVTIDRDELGNPTDDGTWEYTWEHGRQLASMTSGTTTWNYTYDANGLRTSRSNGTATYSYVYNGSQLVQMKRGNDTLHFIYDSTGAPAVVMYNGVPYYYITNLQGDTILIVDSADNIVVEYVVDAWGKVDSISGTMATTLGSLNPLIYRGYVYDHELGLYYLQSRYYNPTIGRFLNADALISTGQGVLGNNMFAYCRNNPIVLEDATGTADRACIYAEGRIDDEPWRDHSPGGGGIPRRNYSSGSNYYGEVADKFYTVRLFRVVGKGLGIGAKWLYEAYMRGYNLQQEAQLLEAQLSLEVSPRIVEAGVEKGFAVAAEYAAVAVAQNIHSGNFDYQAIAKNTALAFVGGFCLGAVTEMVCIFREAIAANNP